MAGSKQPEDEVAELFRSAGQELTEAAGNQPGEVWRFARPTGGVVRPRTLWQVWVDRPADWSAALASLEETRVAAGADRALAVLWEGPLPEGWSTDLERHRSTAITLRRLALELAVVPERVRKDVEDYEQQEGPKYFLRRRGIVNGTPVDDIAAYIVEWSQSDEPRSLALVGKGTGREVVVQEAAYRIGRMFCEEPDQVRPLLREVSRPRVAQTRIPVQNWVCRSLRVTAGVANLKGTSPKSLYLVEPLGARQVEVNESSLLIARLVAPTDEDVLEWYRAHLPPPTGELLATVYRHSSDVAALLRSPPLMRGWLEALAGARLLGGDPISQRVAHTTIAFFAHATSIGRPFAWTLRSRFIEMGEAIEMYSDILEDAALEEFALRRTVTIPSALDELGQLRCIGIGNRKGTGFSNSLVRDYFLARKIIREVQSGQRDILTRYQFPREYVLLFLAILSPEVSAFASEDRSNALRAEIEQQAEQEVQLVLAHHLKRSVGAIRTQVETLQEHLPQGLAPEAERAIRRVGQELEYLHRLADRTRRLHQVPQAEISDVLLADVLDATLSYLRSVMPQVVCTFQVGAEVRVRGNRDSLEEIFSCLLENAFHAVAFEPQDPRVNVTVVDEGATVRVDVVDSGPGVRAEDRARIFDPRVTTKKGGEGRPIGTGMGLPIARKYAEAIGGRVDLDPERPEMTFFVRLVKARGGA